MIKPALVLAVSLLAVRAHAGPQVEAGPAAPSGERPVSAGVETPSLGVGAAAVPALPQAAVISADAAREASAPGAEAAAAAPSAERPAAVAAPGSLPVAGASVSPGAAAGAPSAETESGRESAARRAIEAGTADWAKADPGVVPAADAAAAPILAKPSGERASQAPGPEQPQPPRREPQPEPRGFGGRMLLGQFITGLGFVPLLMGILGIAGTTPLIVGVALLFPGLFLVFRSEPPKDAFLVFLALFGGLFSSFSLAGMLQSGDPGNAWIAGAILGSTGLGMMAIDEIGKKARGGSSGARQVSVWIAFAGYAAGLATMIFLGGWHNGLGVLAGLGLVLGVGVGSLLLPPLLDSLKAMLTRAPKPAPGAPAVSSVDWARLAGLRKQLVWGGGLIGALLSGFVWLFDLTAVSPLFGLVFVAPVAGVTAGFLLWQYADKRK